ncbi:MAG: hypothetical protein AAF914_10850 [Pseudomonadota bacterium]
MARLVISLIWTVVVGALFFAAMQEASRWERGILLLFLAFGLLAIWREYRALRRRQSLRIETENGTTVYVWIELNGTLCRSTEDPRPEWDAADGDGDGDGGGD